MDFANAIAFILNGKGSKTSRQNPYTAGEILTPHPTTSA